MSAEDVFSPPAARLWESAPPSSVPMWLQEWPSRDLSEDRACTCSCWCPACTSLVAGPDPAPVFPPLDLPAVPPLDLGAVPPLDLGAVPPLGLLAQAARALSTATSSDLPEEQALAEAQVLNEVLQQLRVQQLERLADVADRSLHSLAGYRSTRSWLRDTAPDADVTDLSLSGSLETYPTLSDAVRSGEVSVRAAKRVLTSLRLLRPYVDQEDGLIDGRPGTDVVGAVILNLVEVVAVALTGLPDADSMLEALTSQAYRIIASAADGVSELARLERAFTLVAASVPWGALAGCLDRLVVATVPSLLERRAAEARSRAGLEMHRQPDGSSWLVRGTLDAECGERLFTALASESHRDPGRKLDTETWAALRADAGEQGLMLEDVPVAERPRDRGRRLHDALNRLLGRYLDEGLAGSHQKVPLQVNVTLPSSLLEGAPGALPAVGDSGAPLPRSLVRTWWCDSRVTAFVVSRGFKALGYAHLGRTLKGVERRGALIAQENRCAGQGCCPGVPDPLTPLRAHHVYRWSVDGVTRLEDTVMICDSLHHDLHTGGRTVRLRDGRLLREEGWVNDGSADQ